MEKQISVMIADDHPLFLDGLCLALKKLKKQNIELVGEAPDGKILLEKIGHLQPDIVLTDIRMPCLDGIMVCKLIREKYPKVKVIALSMFNERNIIIEMLSAGAKGYLLKNTTKDELLTAILSVYNGGIYYCPETSAHLVSEVADHEIHKNAVREKLTAREIEIIDLICKGYHNKEIASILKLSKRTIENYREKIMEKLELRSSIELVVYAISNGIYKD
jgi:DNA-binding NarL/FixJ family response regulator